MVIRDIYNNVPSWLILLVIVTVFMSVAAAIYWTLRHIFPSFTERGNLQAHAILVGILASTYGIMLGFIIVILWQAFTQVENIVSAEASEFALIVTDSYAFPEKERNKIIDAVARYIKSIRTDEWDAMREGAVSPKTFSALSDLFVLAIQYHPQTYSQQVFYREFIGHLNNAVAYRRQRLSAANSSLPNTLRAIIVVSAILIIIFICVLQSQRKKPDMLKILLVAGVMAANVALVFILDYPFSGDISVSSAPFEQGILADFKL